jgi:glycosyltransferase involved in cell wall biosynthesis
MPIPEPVIEWTSEKSCQARQESVLRLAARESGSCRDLIFFHMVLRDSDFIDALREEAGDVSEADVRMFNLAELARGGDVPIPESEVLEDEDDIWVFYSYVKALLARGRVKDAMAMALACARRFKHDSVALNLVGRYCAMNGESKLALRLLAACLKINPNQSDIALFKESLERGELLEWPLYLDPFPMLAEVCFYVPAYNVEKYIRGAIEGILTQNYPLSEALVIDDGSPDASSEIASEYPVRIIRHPKNMGLAAARNTAFQSSSAEYVGAFDSDAAPEPSYLKYAMMEFENALPKLAGVGGRLRERYTDTPADLWRSVHLGQDPGVFRVHQPRFLYGSNAIFRRSAVLSVGGFQTRHRANYEDVRLSFDLVEHGYELVHTPWAMAYHLRRDTVVSILKTKWSWLYWNRVIGGVFEDPSLLVEQIDATMGESLALVIEDIEAGRSSLFYIDALWPFVDILMTLARAVEVNSLPLGVACFIQEKILLAASRLDFALNGGQGRFVEDIRELMLQGEKSDDASSEPWAPALNATIEAFDNAWAQLAPRIASEFLY